MKHQDRLAAAGTLYPDGWRVDGNLSHHGLVDVLKAGRDSDAAFSEFARALADEAEGDLLLSCEAITTWLLKEEGYDTFSRLLHAAQEVAPVTCLWTLRRFDDMAHSGCVHVSVGGGLSRSAAELMRELRQDRLFASMQALESVVEGGVRYVEYDSAGGHNTELLRACGLPDDVVELVATELKTSSRRNAAYSRKQLAAVVKAEELAARGEVSLDRRSLLQAFDSGDLSFDDDGPCRLAGHDVRLEVHRRALETARRHGLAAYLNFFDRAELGEVPPPTTLASDGLSDEDVERLIAHLGKE
ncbi:MAG TPA: hypothetical protein VFU04_05480 [Solirubrobacterales bacterium]|nr:hypothetical protein [Solirubrobacterales bacterium]